MILAFLLLVVVLALLAVAGGAAMMGMTCAWFLHLPFMTGWHAAWDRPVLLLIFVVFCIPFLALRKS